MREKEPLKWAICLSSFQALDHFSKDCFRIFNEFILIGFILLRPLKDLVKGMTLMDALASDVALAGYKLNGSASVGASGAIGSACVLVVPVYWCHVLVGMYWC